MEYKHPDFEDFFALFNVRKVIYVISGCKVIAFFDEFNNIFDLRIIIQEYAILPRNFEHAVWALDFDYRVPPPLPDRILIVNGERYRQERWYFSRLDWPGFVEALTAIFGPPSN